MPKILVVLEGNSENKPELASQLSDRSHHVETAPEGSLALAALRNTPFDVVICDGPGNGANGVDLLGAVAAEFPDVRCIVAAQNPSVSDSVTALKRGAVDYIPDSEGPETVVAAVEALLSENGRKTGATGCRKDSLEKSEESSEEDSGEDAGEVSGFSGLVGESPAMLKVFKVIRKVARTSSTVLVTGESGTGKELIARAIHAGSDRKGAPMVVINCGAIPGELLESELFGHEKGAFTGAHKSRMGRFEMADGGTLFLDEIGDMSPDLQVKLLRALQEQVFERVGSTRSIRVDVRIISATNKDLPLAIEEGRFREDLFYRLNVIPVPLPPLRKRRSDIPLLVAHFLGKLAERMGERKKTAEDTLELLTAYDWPGNIRELENMMERLSVLVDDEMITAADLPENVTGRSGDGREEILFPLDAGLGFNDAVEKHQRALILDALNRTNWVKAKAAELLKMNRTTLVEKIKKMNLEPAREQALEIGSA